MPSPWHPGPRGLDPEEACVASLELSQDTRKDRIYQNMKRYGTEVDLLRGIAYIWNWNQCQVGDTTGASVSHLSLTTSEFAFLQVVLVWFRVEGNEERRCFPSSSWEHNRLHCPAYLVVRGAYDWALVNRMWREGVYPTCGPSLSALLMQKIPRLREEQRGKMEGVWVSMNDYVEKRTNPFSTHLGCRSLEINFYCAT